MLLLSPLVAGEAKYPSIPKTMLKSTHRIASTTYRKGKDSELVITGHGTAVAVDLSKSGHEQKRFLLTAAHCCVEDGKPLPILIETTREDGKKVWVEGKVVAFDDDIDIALVYANEDMPSLAKIADSDLVDIGDPIFAIGSPQGTSLKATMGYLSEKGEESKINPHEIWRQGSMAITHGNSGGPVFDANREEVVGIITAILLDAPNVAYFVGQPEISKFLSTNSDKIDKYIKKLK